MPPAAFEGGYGFVVSTRFEQAVAMARVTRTVALEAGALGSAVGLLRRLLPGRSFVVVGDRRTMAAAGDRLHGMLAAAGLADGAPLVLEAPGRLKPRVEAAHVIRDRLQGEGAVPIAVGSGVINDLTKYAASLAVQPYVCVATAASMDGYSASGAALLDHGFKRTFACPPPVAVIGDLDVIAAAPPAMVGWGYGDLAGKLPAGADWVLADAAGEEAIDPDVWPMVQDDLARWLSEPAALARGEADALGGLMRGLVVSGLAMQAYGNSRPASGSDHQFSHLWEMEGLAVDGQPVSHGACVGIGCIAILALYDWLLAQDLSTLDVAAAVAARPGLDRLTGEVAAAFADPVLAENAQVEVEAKHASAERVARRLEALKASWPQWRARLAERLPVPTAMQSLLAAVGAPSTPEAIGIDRARLRRDYRRARLIRRRYTVLDVLADCGWLDRAIDALFSPGGFWAENGETLEQAQKKPAKG